MELRHLRYFVAVAEQGNMSRASEVLHLSQPAISKQIKDLEDELGSLLFKRNPHGLALTEAGHTTLKHARTILAQEQSLKKDLHSRSIQQSITIGFLAPALPSFLANAMKEFRQQHPHASFHILEMTPPEQVLALKQNIIDLALIGDPSRDIRKSFDIQPIHTVSVAMIVPDTHPLSSRDSVQLADFAHDSFISLSEESFPGRANFLNGLFKEAGINPNIKAYAHGLSELLGLVASEQGVAIAPRDLDSLANPGVCFLPLSTPNYELEFCAAYKAKQSHKILKEFIASLSSFSKTKDSI